MARRSKMFKNSHKASFSPKLTGGASHKQLGYLQQPKGGKHIFNASKKRQRRRYLAYLAGLLALIALIYYGITLLYQ